MSPRSSFSIPVVVNLCSLSCGLFTHFRKNRPTLCIRSSLKIVFPRPPIWISKLESSLNQDLGSLPCVHCSPVRDVDESLSPVPDLGHPGLQSSRPVLEGRVSKWDPCARDLVDLWDDANSPSITSSTVRVWTETRWRSPPLRSSKVHPRSLPGLWERDHRDLSSCRIYTSSFPNHDSPNSLQMWAGRTSVRKSVQTSLDGGRTSVLHGPKVPTKNSTGKSHLFDGPLYFHLNLCG